MSKDIFQYGEVIAVRSNNLDHWEIDRFVLFSEHYTCSPFICSKKWKYARKLNAEERGEPSNPVARRQEVYTIYDLESYAKLHGIVPYK